MKKSFILGTREDKELQIGKNDLKAIVRINSH